MKIEKKNYARPEVARMDVDVEAGFASSIGDVLDQDDGIFGTENYDSGGF